MSNEIFTDDNGKESLADSEDGIVFILLLHVYMYSV